MEAPCRCGCRAVAGDAVHRVAQALAVDDLDRALDAGLLALPPCPACTAECQAGVAAAARSRSAALEARERYLARAARLARRAEERAARRRPPAPTGLPPAAAAALARAMSRARGGG